jgi:hypothetical protein
MSPQRPPILLSIHDLMPHTLERVERIIERIDPQAPDRLTLLVVPGLDWSDRQLERLRALQAAGYDLAGHGWTHKARRIGGLYHRLHSLMLSRDVAEHLCEDRRSLRAMLQACYDWFPSVGLARPSLYVPPAWAMGPLRRADLRDLPFRWYENLGGVYDAREDRYDRLPVVGYEADTPIRAGSLRVANAMARAWARCLGRALRVSIHPFDPEFRLADRLWADLNQPMRRWGYDSLSDPPTPSPSPTIRS